MLDYPMMWGMAEDQAEGYAARDPFPYIAIDNFLPEEVAQTLLDECPSPESPFWRRNETPHTVNKRTPDAAYGTTLLKEISFPQRSRVIFHELNSAPFLFFLQRLTGIKKLIADPYFLEGGYHCSGDGGRLDIHADFSHHSFLDLERRINVLIYLNREWRDDWGGHLELRDTFGNVRAKIAPAFNRAVIFTTSRSSYHGHPEPMRLPPGVWRRSAAMYYYTLPRAEREKHPIIFPQHEAIAA